MSVRCNRRSVCLAVLIATIWGCDKSATPQAPGTGGVPPGAAAPSASPTAQPPQPPSPAPNAVAPSRDGPRWQCDPSTIDFGEVWVGAVIERNFEFRNAGTETLLIDKPKPHCSCSSSPNYTAEVPPGGSGIIPFILKTDNKPNGPLNEYLTIETNDPTNKSTKVWLKGVVRTVLDAVVTYDLRYEQQKAAGLDVEFPAQHKAFFDKVDPNERQHRVIKLQNTSGQPLSLTLMPVRAGSVFQAELKETVPGEEFELTVTAEPPIEVGRWATPIRFKTNVPQQPIYDLTAYLYVAPRVELIPPKIVIDQQLFLQRSRKITITNYGTTPVEVTAIATSEPQYKISLLPRDPEEPQKQVINIDLPMIDGKPYTPPDYGELIEIKTNDAEFPVFRVPVQPRTGSQNAPRPPDKPLQLHPVQLSNG